MIFFLFFSLLWTSVFHHQNQLSSVSLRRDVGLLNVLLNLHCNDFYLICDILRFCSVLIFESILCSLFRNYLNWLGGFYGDINVNLFILVSMVSFSKVLSFLCALWYLGKEWVHFKCYKSWNTSSLESKEPGNGVQINTSWRGND